MAEDELVSSRDELRENVDTLHRFASGDGAERSFHRKRIKNGKNFVATKTPDGWRFSPSKFAGYTNNGLHHADRLDRRDGRVTDAQISKLVGAPLVSGDTGYPDIDREFKNYCSGHGIEPSRHPRARRYWTV